MYYSLHLILRILMAIEGGMVVSISFLLYCIIVTFTPGPTNLIILSTVQQTDVKRAMHYTYGATLAFGVLLILSALLNTALQNILPKILWIMQIAGSVYMLYLAYHLIKATGESEAKPANGQFRSGFLMQFLNPKVVIFTMTVLPTFILPYYTTFKSIAGSVALITLIGFAAFVTWVLFGTMFKRFLQRHEVIFNKVMAAFLVYSAVMIWL